MSKVETIYPVTDTSCRALWCAVIHQALLDLTYDGDLPDRITDKERAERWIFTSNNTFNYVCSLADIVPQAVRKRAKEVKASPSLLGVRI